ncbi:related to transcription factor mbp1 [Lichtheimia corymbifera JMRC:FSU:9682]|uniref:Related to transcription factor mbp1 n=1 Tax=Lichtheimia corymbifera JMRC:FSU:9682 TaxID=1263082 RepID=A0A068S9L9_9FUNG|nr:related to transcription factor mbp1 [Lichtheimia corymbifera JMRC:FSU:9682]
MTIAGLIYRVNYSNTPVFELAVGDVAVMRRKNDSYMNATQILKAAGMEKTKRAKILDREVLIGDHQKVQGGFGKYQGTWIPLDKARQLAERHGIFHQIQPLLDIDPADFELYPEKDPTTTNKERKTTAAAKAAVESSPMVATPFSTDTMVIDNESVDWPDHDTIHTNDPGEHPQQQQPFSLLVDAALGRVKNVELLLKQGVDVGYTNHAGETALMQAVRHTHCYETKCFSRMLVALHDTLFTVDRDGQSALHHAVAFAANDTNDKAYPASMYYIKQLVSYGQQRLLSIKDINGDSAADIAMRSGLEAVAKVLLKGDSMQPCSTSSGSTAKGRDLVLSVQKAVDSIDTEYIAQLRERDQALEKAQGQLRKATQQLQQLQSKLQQKEVERRQQHAELNIPPLSLLEQCNMTREQWLEEQMKLLQAQVATHAQTRQVLSQQITQLQNRTSQTEIQCKRLIAACCNLPIDKVDLLLDPLLAAVESDPPDESFQQVVGFMDGVKRKRHQ